MNAPAPIPTRAPISGPVELQNLASCPACRRLILAAIFPGPFKVSTWDPRPEWFESYRAHFRAPAFRAARELAEAQRFSTKLGYGAAHDCADLFSREADESGPKGGRS